MNLQMIKKKHQYYVWEKVEAGQAEGLLGRMKERLIRENNLPHDSELSFIAYAFKNENLLVLAV